MIKFSEGGEKMSTELQNKKVNGMTKKVLDTVLKLEANSASCLVLFQPKTPDKLSKFKK